ncbi:MAG: S-layer homology domain-containing protein [Oscillospiraceae bacterium]|nr:S-layer homology domain-containing protein [Oscillospiraceae bacterium]
MTRNTTVGKIIANPALDDFGRLLFPVDRAVSEDMTLAEVSTSSVYVWYSNIQVDKTVDIVNNVISRAEGGEQVFYPIYSEEEMSADPSKRDTGLFFFRGEPGAKFAVVNAGGFMYVGAMHDSFPHALELSRMGYNAFALIYRPDDPYTDLAQAIAYIYDHADELQVNPEGYSLWGGSAGARMAAVLGNGDTLAQFGRPDIPQAAAVIMQYTGYTTVSPQDAPTYVCVGTNDGIANWRTMQARLEGLEALGIPTEFHAYEGLGHGFGLGTGTVAEGWIKDAVNFWDGSFRDVPSDAWYADAVNYVQENGLMSGTSSTVFSPDATMDRAMLATVLWRMAGEPQVNDLAQFSDVQSGQWYTEAVRWAASERLISGYGNGRFGTGDPVTREQLAAILWRYEGSPWADAGADFTDEASIAQWAATAVDWARANGVMNGRNNNRFAPQDSASRAEVAQILMNYLQTKQDHGPAATPSRPNTSVSGDTVATAVVTPHAQQTLYLWEEGNAPATTQYTVNNGNYSDDPDFRPYITFYPVPEGTAIKGAVMICPGGAFMFRSDGPEGVSVAQALSARGYQSFVVDYRLRPYTQQEGALDLARAVRFVRAHADEYGIDQRDIAVMGFSAGGILGGEMLLHWDGQVAPTALDPNYVPDELDKVSADATADGMIYSFYGRLSVGTTDVDLLRSGELPPTFYCYGTRDPFYRQFLANADAAEEAGVRVERLQLDNMPHGFGASGGWVPAFDEFLTGIFQSNLA